MDEETIDNPESAVGKIGEFIDSENRTCQCRVTRVDREDEPDKPLLVVDYCHPVTHKIVVGAFIGPDEFAPAQ